MYLYVLELWQYLTSPKSKQNQHDFDQNEIREPNVLQMNKSKK